MTFILDRNVIDLSKVHLQFVIEYGNNFVSLNEGEFGWYKIKG